MKNSFLFVSVILILSIKCYSQEFTFEESMETYSELENPVSLTNGDCWDDVNFEITADLPISDWFGTAVNKITIQDSRVILGELTDVNIIAPFSTNLYCNGIDASSSGIGYELGENNEGIKLMKIEWKQTGFSYLEGFFDLINFQCWIYENGIIEFHYGNGETSLAEEAYMENGETFGGLCGLSIGAFDAYFVEGTSDLFVFKNGPINITNPPLLTSFPASGTIYRFSPTSSSASHINELLDFQLVNTICSNELYFSSEIERAKIDYIIYNQHGKLIHKGQLSTQEGKINVQDLTSGQYYFNAIVKNDRRSIPFIKQ